MIACLGSSSFSYPLLKFDIVAEQRYKEKPSEAKACPYVKRF